MGRYDCPTCQPEALLRDQARAHLLAILDAAFPNLVDRSDRQSDYFDRCWSIS